MNLYQPTISGSLVVSGSVSVIGPFTMSGGSITGTASFASNSGLLSNLDSGSFVGTGSFNTMSSSVSTRVTTIESKYATTGSNIFTGAQTVCANITSTGTIIAQTLNVQQVTSSVVYSSGSNIFGCALINTQQFTGSVTMTGSLGVFTSGTTPEFQVAIGGTTHGNAITDVHQMTGSLRITGSNAVLSVGCVGIGIATPLVPLHVETTGTSTSMGSNVISTFRSQASGRTATIQLSDNTNSNYISSLSGCLGFGSGGTELMRITSTGNVGIGTGSLINSAGYTRLLNVYDASSAAVGISIASNDYQLGVESDGGFRIRYNGTQRFLMSNTGAATFSVCSNSSLRNTIQNTSNGSAAIGGITLNNDGGLIGAINAFGTGYTTSNVNIANSIAIGAGGAGLQLDAYGATGKIRMYTGASEILTMTIDENQRVGIGIGTPCSKLQINDSGTGAYTILTIANRQGRAAGVGARINLLPNSDFTAGVDTGAAISAVNSSGNVNNDTNLIFETSIVGTGYERMRITSAGNVGIGTCTPDTYSYGGSRSFLTFQANGTNQEPFLQLIANGTGNSLIDFGNTTIRRASIIGFDGSSLAFFTNGCNSGTTTTERMRINSNGSIQMSNNSTTFSIGSIAGVQRIQYGTGGFTTEFAFLQPNDGYTPIGASAFNTRSDYRLKEDLKQFNGINLISRMRVYDFKWKEKEERNYGFMAHELQEVVPYVVSGEKDGMFEDAPKYQGMDASKLVPILVKAIQEQQCKINILESCLGIN